MPGAHNRGAAAPRFGLGVALTTPFATDGGIDVALLVDHARGLLARGCSTLTLFGTTGEGPSIARREREPVLQAFARASLDARTHLVGTVAETSVVAAVEHARMFLDADFRAVLLLPPFYFKDVDELGVYAWYAAVFDGLGASARDVLVYDIPQLAAVRMPGSFFRRLKSAFPEVVVGVKYSSDDAAHVDELLAVEPPLSVLIGDERLLGPTVRRGGAGAISGLANIVPEVLLPVATRGDDDPRVAALVDAVLRHPVTPAVKAVLATTTGDRRWLAVRPPLHALDEGQVAALAEAWNASS